MQNRKVLNYILLRLLGKGGMAEVWYAENQIEKPAAVKILNEDLSHNAQIVERFRNEAKITVKLNHPNIRQVYDYDEIDGRPCMVMEYLEGADLSSRMKNGERFTDEQLEKWWNQLASALNYTHAQGVVHRDIKPSNIFIDREGNVKLLDFGIAKVRDSITATHTGTTMGTLMYMSPEQADDAKHVDGRSDIYSLAVSFVSLMQGHAPYNEQTDSQRAILNHIAEHPLDMTGVPAQWQNFLRPYLAKNPKDRPALTEFGVEASPVDFVPPVTPLVAPSAPVSEETFVGSATVASASATDEGTMAETPSAQTQSQPQPRKAWPWILAACAVVAAVVVCVVLLGGGKKGSKLEDKVSQLEAIPNAVTDIDGNTYNAVQIGEQVWMAENLKVTKDRDGKEIALGSETSYSTPYRYCPNNDPKNVEKYGYLYNWEAAMRVCPKGWHLPTDEEWAQLTDYVSSQNQYVCGGDEIKIAKALASMEGWKSADESCTVGNNPSGNNATGFGALPAGDYNGSYGFFGTDAFFWSATEDGSYVAWCRFLGYDYADVGRSSYNKGCVLSVRCVRD
ncbi:MAG: protein kinase [Bacteroidales bacterium]|nr:protein kinase [Bacteroidales bacterium]